MNLHAPTPFAQSGQGYFRRDLCERILLNLRWPWVNLGKFLIPSQTAKLVQISRGLPERASKKCSYWKNQLSTWTL